MRVPSILDDTSQPTEHPRSDHGHHGGSPRQRLSRRSRHGRDRRSPAFRHESRRRPAVAVLVELEERDDIARLVIGMKRRSRVGKALMGSVSQRLLLDSPVPVLAVKA
ncbi:universal stress protein [Brevibacterium sp. Mu109]|uniref:universal stress protein n=1 Tax=Brevibacterium sp. Mu109 TaxID=1255669 RepID=UPI0021523397|nr:universal stress protein [Brevibacterium sp. Mu109]